MGLVVVVKAISDGVLMVVVVVVVGGGGGGVFGARLAPVHSDGHSIPFLVNSLSSLPSLSLSLCLPAISSSGKIPVPGTRAYVR